MLNPESNNLKIKIDPQNGSYVGGLQEEIVLSPQKIEELMDAGDLSRHVGVTDMNERSSRSHTIFRLIVESRERLVQGKTEEEIDGGIRVATLSLVDLAGSERASATANHSSRFKEGMYINKSLLTLGTVMSKLANGNP